MVEVPKKESAQQLLGQAQLYQQQMQGIMSHKEFMNAQLTEINRALEALEKTAERDVFKITGPILIKTGKAEVKRELGEKKEAIALRLRSIGKSETRLKAQLEELRAKLSNIRTE